MKTERQGDTRTSSIPSCAWRSERRSPLRAPLATEAKADSETNDEKRKSRYRESDHVKAYYRVNRYPS